MFSKLVFKIFEESIFTYYIKDTINQLFENLHLKNDISHFLNRRNWIDTTQLHYEDIIRYPNINAKDTMVLK